MANFPEVRQAGGSSWRFAHGVEQLPHAVLYVRDALRLSIEPASSVPPALCEQIEDRSELLDPQTRSDAAREWAAWWAVLVDFEAERHFSSGDQNHLAIHARFAEYDRAVNPATSPVLAGASLQPAAEALFDDACSWRRSFDVQDPAGRRRAPASEVVRDAAEAVAEAHAVEPGSIDGAASILLVDGIWWDLAAPRFALCSRAAAQDPDTARAMLTSVFESGLAFD